MGRLDPSAASLMVPISADPDWLQFKVKSPWLEPL
jgi:hypothetical protein